jgi:hypothetical protein
MKKKRGPIRERYERLVAEMYDGDGDTRERSPEPAA